MVSRSLAASSSEMSSPPMWAMSLRIWRTSTVQEFALPLMNTLKQFFQLPRSTLQQAETSSASVRSPKSVSWLRRYCSSSKRVAKGTTASCHQSWSFF